MKKGKWNQILSDAAKHTIVGDVELITGFKIPQLSRKRRIWVYLPPDYQKTDKNYPVIYMHDGQNVFDKATSNFGEWKVDESLEEIFSKNKSLECIVVAVDCDSEKRLNEYSPWKAIKANYGGEGIKYVNFLINTLKPYIDSNYQTLSTRDNTAIAGSSMGGLISLYAALKHSNVFSKVAALSPAFFFAPDKLRNFLLNYKKEEEIKIYLDVGTTENLVVSSAGIKINNQDYLQDVNSIYNLLQETGFSHQELKKVIAPGHEHSEYYWSQRFPIAFKWLFEEVVE